MTRQAAAVRTSTLQRTEAQRTDSQVPTEQWYRVEDPFTTAEADAAFAAFMAGDNPHLRTEEVPVVDFSSMIEEVGPDGRPVGQPSRGGARMKIVVAALATIVMLGAAAVFGLIEIPGVDAVVPDAGEPVSITDGD